MKGKKKRKEEEAMFLPVAIIIDALLRVPLDSSTPLLLSLFLPLSPNLLDPNLDLEG
jgi:hypothetical protein